MKKLILLGILFLFSSVTFSQSRNPGIRKESYLIVKVRDSIVFSERVTNHSSLGGDYFKGSNFGLTFYDTKKLSSGIHHFIPIVDASLFSPSELLDLFQNYPVNPAKLETVGKPEKNIVRIHFIWDFTYEIPGISKFPARIKKDVKDLKLYMVDMVDSQHLEKLSFPDYIKIYIKEVEIKLN